MRRISVWQFAGVVLGCILQASCITSGGTARLAKSQTFEGNIDEIWLLAVETVNSFGGTLDRIDRATGAIHASRSKSTFPGDSDSVLLRISPVNAELTRVEIISTEGVHSRLNGNIWSTEIAGRMQLRLRRMRDASQEASRANSSVQPNADAIREPQVRKFSYDSATAKGVVVVDIAKFGIKGRDWTIQNIGKIASSKEHLLEAGAEMTTGGQYKVLNETLQDGILTVEFEVLH
jgi:hypothetical protein